MLLHDPKKKKKRPVKIESNRSCKPGMQEKEKYGRVHTVIAAIGAR